MESKEGVTPQYYCSTSCTTCQPCLVMFFTCVHWNYFVVQFAYITVLNWSTMRCMWYGHWRMYDNHSMSKWRKVQQYRRQLHMHMPHGMLWQCMNMSMKCMSPALNESLVIWHFKQSKSKYATELIVKISYFRSAFGYKSKYTGLKVVLLTYWSVEKRLDVIFVHIVVFQSCKYQMLHH